MHCTKAHSCYEDPQLSLFGYTGHVDGVQTLYTEIGAHMCQLVTKDGPLNYFIHTSLRMTAVQSDYFFKLLLTRALLADICKPLEQQVADYNCGGAYDINQQMKERKML